MGLELRGAGAPILLARQRREQRAAQKVVIWREVSAAGGDAVFRQDEGEDVRPLRARQLAARTLLAFIANAGHEHREGQSAPVGAEFEAGQRRRNAVAVALGFLAVAGTAATVARSRLTPRCS